MRTLNMPVLDEQVLMSILDMISLGKEGRQPYIHSVPVD
jgi:hypothetical protein